MCTSGHPYGIIADLNHTWVTTDPEVAIFGYVCVISKVHAVEPFDLPDQGAAFWQEAMAVAQVVNQLPNRISISGHTSASAGGACHRRFETDSTFANGSG